MLESCVRWWPSFSPSHLPWWAASAGARTGNDFFNRLERLPGRWIYHPCFFFVVGVAEGGMAANKAPTPLDTASLRERNCLQCFSVFKSSTARAQVTQQVSVVLCGWNDMAIFYGPFTSTWWSEHLRQDRQLPHNSNCVLVVLPGS